ncbi:MAG: hypothetical protein F6J97_22940 [Leptolyngbya sp. SIO4C1]|nr:hypothetical protein [Leptolyngbya sp. SIO4C1]
MLHSRFRLRHLFALSLLITAMGARPVKAAPVGLDFSLPASTAASKTAASATTASATTASATAAAAGQPPPAAPTESNAFAMAGYESLPIPLAAVQPPLQSGQIRQSAQSKAERVAQLPPPPGVPTTRILPPLSATSAAPLPQSAAEIALSFNPDKSQLPEIPVEKPVAAQPVNLQAPDLSWIFEGGSESLVARAIGSAEGTRTARGEKTVAYYGHTDPGNGVWNLGTFSYQHAAQSPEEADSRQLVRLQQQEQTLNQKAQYSGLDLSLSEKLNGLDLANQAPRAALDRGGYVERLAEARQQGLDGAEAILWARTYAYLDPDTEHWDAPGLGNTFSSINRDQKRRQKAIERVLAGYEPETAIAQPPQPQVPEPVPSVVAAADPPLGAEPGDVLFDDFTPDRLSFVLPTEHPDEAAQKQPQKSRLPLQTGFTLPAADANANADANMDADMDANTGAAIAQPAEDDTDRFLSTDFDQIEPQS